MYPNDFGVWNRTSEGGLKTLGLWPEFEGGLHGGQRYEAVNKILLQLRDGLSVDLWTLDALFWRVLANRGTGHEIEDDAESIGVEDVATDPRAAAGRGHRFPPPGAGERRDGRSRKGVGRCETETGKFRPCN